MLSQVDTIAALGTPVGVSALGVIRASGPAVGRIVGEIFGMTPMPRMLTRGDYRDLGGTVVDDVLFVYFAAPNSYTGDDALEISCHGNPFIAQRILDDLMVRGCRPAEAGEFTRRAFLNGRLDLSQAEAVMDLIQARSESALAAANRQLRGGLGAALAPLTAQLVDALARIEAYIDFPEEDLPAEDRAGVLKTVEALLAATGRLIATESYGTLLREGIRTVILGEPNAGKSSVMNRLLERDRALVSPEPGTTRDYLEEPVRIGTHLFRLIDTAGLNSRPSEIERRGIAKTLEQAADADVFIWVIDGSVEAAPLPDDVAKRLTSGNSIVLMNKSDLVAARRPGSLDARQLEVSARTGDGFPKLREALQALGDSLAQAVGVEGIAVNVRHAESLRRVALALGEAKRKLTGAGATELIASDLREAWLAIGEITGKVDDEAVLDRLFSTFCIGK